MRFSFRQIFKCKIDHFDTFPHLGFTYIETIVDIAVFSYGYNEIKIFIRTVWRLNTNIIIHTICPKIRPGYAVVQSALGRNAPHIDGTIHKNAVAYQQVFELGQHFGQAFHQITNFLNCFRSEIGVETSHTSQIRGKTGTANFFKNFVNRFTFLKHINESCQRATIHTNHTITYQVVGNTCQLHDNDAHVIDAFVGFYSQKFFYSQMPTNVVDRR